MGRDKEGEEGKILYLFGEVNDEQTREISGRLLDGWRREFLLVINSDGGSCHNALCLINLIRQHGRVDTFCPGVAESAGADCLAAGRRRYILPSTIVMIHQVSWDLGREYSANMLKSALALNRLNSLMSDYLSTATGKSREQIDRDTATDFYLYGQEVIDYGLADSFWDSSRGLPLPLPEARGGRLRAEMSDTRRRRK